MSQKQSIKRPLISIIIIISSLFVLVFVKMEVRKQGYTVYKISKKLKKMKDKNRLMTMKLAKVFRPERVRGLIMSQVSQEYIHSGKIIQMTQKGAAFATK
jgi:hypothetical protein